MLWGSYFVRPVGPVRGRNRDLARIEVALRENRPVLVRGAAGVGITTVLEESARRAGLFDRRVLRPAPEPWSLDPSGVVDRVLDALLAPEPTVVVIDDAEMFGARELARLVRATTQMHAGLLIGAHGDVPAVSSDAESTVVDLVGLERQAVADVVSAALGERFTVRSPLVAAFHRASGGNPSMLRAILDEPELREVFETARDVEDPSLLAPQLQRALPVSVHTNLIRLDGSARLALAVVALTDTHAPADLVTLAAGPQALQACVDTGLLTLTRRGQHVVRHGAVRRLLVEELPEELMVEARWRLAVAAQAVGLRAEPEIAGALTLRSA